MRGQRTERLVRLAAKFMMCPSKLVSLTDLATKFNVSKTVISDDVEVINSAMEAEGFGQMMVDRGRSGGARFIPVCTPEYRRAFLTEIAEKLADPATPRGICRAALSTTATSYSTPNPRYCSATAWRRFSRKPSPTS